ncbi:MAG TPA: ankyrin repeat domain-containing protein [Polyangiaceae bacterium]|nr:ankyrin repeat domain-containing protein [Polyangiaceae bacterium]
MSDSSDADDPPRSETTSVGELRTALGEGDPRRVSALIEAGADIHYKRDHGYDALLDAVHGRDVARDPRLLDLLALLVAHGVDRSGVSAYGESGLRVLSRLGRFDAVRLLLGAGADKRQLGWTPLMEAVALGSLTDVQAALAQGAALEERDWWSRTAWLIALLAGDVAKATFLREHGADPNALGRCGTPPLFYAIRGHHPDMVRWLLREGADIHQTDEFGGTALIEAVENDDLECVEILLGAGASVDASSNGSVLGRGASRDILMRLLDAGADPADLTYGGQRILLGLPAVGGDALAAVSPDDFRRAFTRSFGKGNPERMSAPFWVAMVRCGASAYKARRRFEDICGPRADPVWCAQRFGQSLTFLPDGRAIQIGGEHEDYYDPDFCIYNDVLVYERDGSVAIYGYPESVFPPTDFHTATRVGDSIYVIGSLGYLGARRYGETPVYRLDVRTLRMDRLDTRGEAPGWVYKHRAAAVSPREIRVWGGTVVTANGSEESYEPTPGSFVLDLDRLRWRRESTPEPPPTP